MLLWNMLAVPCTGIYKSVQELGVRLKENSPSIVPSFSNLRLTYVARLLQCELSLLQSKSRLGYNGYMN